jgi:protein-disulfide isomerase
MENIDKKWYKRWWDALGLIILVLFLAFGVAFAFYIYNLSKEIKEKNKFPAPAVKIDESRRVLIEGSGNYSLGSAKPIITIVEFSDFACPYCKNSSAKIREIIIKYKDTIKYTFRDMPLHENSVDLALAGRCAGEQGLFWPMHDKLFQDQGTFETANLPELVGQIGADKVKFKNCFDNKKYLTQITKDYSDGDALGVKGTPAWFINGEKIEGDIPLETWEEIIKNYIKQ